MTTKTAPSFKLHQLPNGNTLHAAHWGDPSKPLMLFVHGFPEFWFAWRDLAPRFASTHYCVAPDLRGFNLSSQPTELSEYKAPKLIQDLALLIADCGQKSAVVVSHDWGGAVAWGLAISMPATVSRLVSINSPHPGTFARELVNSPEQQAASAYMLWLRAPEAAAKLSADNFAKLKSFMLAMSSDKGWFTPEVEAEYERCWARGLEGGLNYYRSTPLIPPSEASPGARAWTPKAADITVTVPTLIIWGLEDSALLPSLLDGIEQWIPKLRIERVPGASHWIVHEQPDVVEALVRGFVEEAVA
jgi:epoxide hydrolase 4